jgi:hypothetical protein
VRPPPEQWSSRLGPASSDRSFARSFICSLARSLAARLTEIPPKTSLCVLRASPLSSFLLFGGFRLGRNYEQVSVDTCYTHITVLGTPCTSLPQIDIRSPGTDSEKVNQIIASSRKDTRQDTTRRTHTGSKDDAPGLRCADTSPLARAFLRHQPYPPYPDITPARTHASRCCLFLGSPKKETQRDATNPIAARVQPKGLWTVRVPLKAQAQSQSQARARAQVLRPRGGRSKISVRCIIRSVWDVTACFGRADKSRATKEALPKREQLVSWRQSRIAISSAYWYILVYRIHSRRLVVSSTKTRTRTTHRTAPHRTSHAWWWFGGHEA